MDPTIPERSRVSSIDAWLARALGCRSEVVLAARLSEAGHVETLVPGADNLRWPVLDVSTTGGRSGATALLRVAPLQLGRAGDPGASSLGRWLREWRDHGAACGGPGVLSLAPGVHEERTAAPVLPPLYHCTAKSVWIPVVCVGCAGPSAARAQDETRCPTCGSPRDGGEARTTSSGIRVLERLWERVTSAAADAGPDAGPAAPPCLGCDSRDRCFAADGPEAGEAASVLEPLSAKPWGGAVTEPVHVPLTRFLRMIDDTSSADGVEPDLPEVPASLGREVSRSIRQDRRRLGGEDDRQRFPVEGLLLRLEVLRQILEGLSDLASTAGHPHLAVAPDRIWVRLREPDMLRTGLWTAQVRFLDSAPGWSPGEAGIPTWVPPQGRAPELTPPGCGEAASLLEGLGIPRSSSGSSDGSSVRIDFLPDSPFQKPPAKGDAVRVFLAPAQGGSALSILGTIEHAFSDMCRVVVSRGAAGGVELVERLGKAGGGLPVRLRLERDHTLVDDLFAAGTVWLSMLVRETGSIGEAARLRDLLAVRLRGGVPGGKIEVAEKELLRVASAAGLLAYRAEGGDGELPALPAAILGSSLALAMRLCGAIPGSYPGQRHEPTTDEERSTAHESVKAAVVDLARRVRDAFLRSPDEGRPAARGRPAADAGRPADAEPIRGEAVSQLRRVLGPELPADAPVTPEVLASWQRVVEVVFGMLLEHDSVFQRLLIDLRASSTPGSGRGGTVIGLRLESPLARLISQCIRGEGDVSELERRLKRFGSASLLFYQAHSASVREATRAMRRHLDPQAIQKEHGLGGAWQAYRRAYHQDLYELGPEFVQIFVSKPFVANFFKALKDLKASDSP